MKLSGDPDVFHEYEYEIEDGPIVEGRINATIPNSLEPKSRRTRVFVGEKEITGPDVEVRITKAKFRVFPHEEDGPYIDVFVTGTRLSEDRLLMIDHPALLVHERDISDDVLEQFLAQHPEYRAS